MFRRHVLLGSCVLLASLVACRREQAPTPGAPAARSARTQGAPAPIAPVGLQDVVEHDPRYVIGISYPPAANQYPGLAAELKRYADTARGELLQAVNGLGGRKPEAPYELSLSFTELVATPEIIVVAADGSSYTGGAHGNPLVARFVWLRQPDKPLTATELIPDPAAWRELSGYVREQLHAALSQRIDADDLPPAERAEMVKDAGRMIDEGTTPEVSNFAQFEPVVASDGRITALRFVFPPYQVGPYADGMQTVDVPTDVLTPWIAPPYRKLFAGG